MDTVTTTEPTAGSRMTNRELLMQRLLDDFQSPENFGIIESLVEGTCGVSLRLLDFFLCHYSLKHNVQYRLPDEALPFHVHDEYSQMLAGYGTGQGCGCVYVCKRARSDDEDGDCRQGAFRLLQPETASGAAARRQGYRDECGAGFCSNLSYASSSKTTFPS